MITGFATVSSAVDALKKGAAHYLPKPINLDELRATVRQILDKKKHKLMTRSPILCFAGPPGTGKTSIGKAIAEALERKFIRLSLAGFRDEAELRGHRRTYVGAMAGRIINEIKRVGVKNPVFMLDELDKIGQDFRGDPASVLLEILDPEQNTQFTDHYLDIPFDLSSVMFIATANMVEKIPAPLLDRLEIIQFAGHTEKEKQAIAKNHIIQDSIITERQDESIRLKGKTIGDFAGKLLLLKRQRIHLALAGILGLPFVFLAIFVVLSMLIVQLLFNRILKPLALIRRTIDRIALGDLSPIHYEENARDEISMLIYAFNRMAGELESKQGQLVQSRKIAAIGTFTAGIAHELNNPINNIYLTAESIMEDYSTLSESEAKELLSDVLSQADRAGDIIKNLLDFSRNEMPSFTDLDIKEVIQKALKLVKNQTMLSGIMVETAISPDIPSVRGNFRNLEQVFLNLFINAIQAMLKNMGDMLKCKVR